MTDKLPAKVKVLYGVQLASNPITRRKQDPDEKNKLNIKTSAAFNNNLRLLSQQVEYLESSFSSSDSPSLIHVKDIFTTVGMSLIQRNSQLRKADGSQLNEFGKHFNKIRAGIDYSNSSIVGTLSEFSNLDGDGDATLEYTLINYYDSIGVDPFDLPADKHSQVINQLGLDLNWRELIAKIDAAWDLDDTSVIRKFIKSHLIPPSITSSLKSKMLMCSLGNNELEFLDLLYTEEYLDINLKDKFMEVLAFSPIGSFIRFYLALTLEALVTVNLYITSLPEEISMMNYIDFTTSQYADEKQAIAEFLGLGYDCMSILEGVKVFDDADKIKQLFANEISNLVVTEISTTSKYRLGDFYVRS